jgi:hypothetical protein
MKKKPAGRKRKRGYSTGEWFMVVLGVALIVLVVGIVVSTVLGE